MTGLDTAIADLPTTIERAAGGDIQALARIIDRYHDEMAQVCTVICADSAAAEDAVQNAWPIVWRRLGGLREPDRLRPWLITIAVNEARLLQRRERRRRVVEIQVGGRPDRAGDPDGQVAMLDLRRALLALEPAERALLALRYVAGFDSGEIGRALGISASGVRSRLERLLARLRTELTDV